MIECLSVWFAASDSIPKTKLLLLTRVFEIFIKQEVYGKEAAKISWYSKKHGPAF